MRYTTFKGKEDLVKAIDRAAAHYATARTAAQNAAIGILLHAAKHGDYSLANTLVEGIGTGDATPLVKWFVEFGGLTISEESKAFDGWQGKQYIADRMDTAKSTMFWSYKEKSPYAGFDLEQALAGLIDKANKAKKKADLALSKGDKETVDKVHVNPDDLQRLIQLKASMSTTVQ